MNKKHTYLIIVLLILASLIAFGRILGNDFVNFDNYQYITKNSHIKESINTKSIIWAFTTPYASNYHPLTWLSHMLDWRLFGANASGHHLVNLLWHISSAILLFLFLSKTTGSLWPSAFVAALFVLHPLRVESVAWAAERKDVLSVFFGMATLYAYAYYVEKPKLSKYFLCLILFALALLSKPMLVTLPFVMLLLDYWPLGRWQKLLTPQSVPVLVDRGAGQKKCKKLKVKSSVDKKIAKSDQSGRQLVGNLLWEKLPFIFLTIVSSIVTIWAQGKGGAIASLRKFSFFERVANAVISYISYLGKTFWPVDLVVFYPYQHSFQIWQALVASLLLLGLSTAVIYLARKAPFLAVGWFWYIGILFPVIGLMQVGDQAMADRYTYFPSVGIAIMLTWGVVYLSKEKLHKIMIIPAAIILATLTFLTWHQCGYWKNSIKLFNHTLQATKNNGIAHYTLGAALAAQGKFEEAIAHYLAAIEIHPNYYKAHNNLGVALAAQGKIEEAITHYRVAIEIHPNNDEAHYNLGLALAAQGKTDEAIVHYLAAVDINPDNDSYLGNLGLALAAQGKTDEAISHYQAALKIRPDLADIHYNLAITFKKQGKLDEAIVHYRETLRINSNHIKAHNNLAIILYDQNKQDEAIYHFRQARQIDPNDPGTHFNFGIALAKRVNYKEAIEHFQKAIYLKPDYEDARRALNLAREMEKRQKR